MVVKPSNPWQCTFDCTSKGHTSTRPSTRHFKWTVNSLTKEIMIAAGMEVTELLCVRSFVLTRMLLSCLWLLAQSPAWLLLSGQGKCWVTWLEPQGLNLGVTGFLKAYRSAWMLECVAGCLCVTGCQLVCEITFAYGFVLDCICVFLAYVCLWSPVCVSVVHSCLIDTFGCYCSWQDVFSLLFCFAVKSAGKYPLLCFGQNRPLKTAMNFYATGALTGTFICSGSIYYWGGIKPQQICLISVPSGISSNLNLVHSSLQMHRHTHKTCRSQFLLRFCIQTPKTILLVPLSTSKIKIKAGCGIQQWAELPVYSLRLGVCPPRVESMTAEITLTLKPKIQIQTVAVLKVTANDTEGKRLYSIYNPVQFCTPNNRKQDGMLS